jgi:hypothetical protein
MDLYALTRLFVGPKRPLMWLLLSFCPPHLFLSDTKPASVWRCGLLSNLTTTQRGLSCLAFGKSSNMRAAFCIFHPYMQPKTFGRLGVHNVKLGSRVISLQASWGSHVGNQHGWAGLCEGASPVTVSPFLQPLGRASRWRIVFVGKSNMSIVMACTPSFMHQCLWDYKNRGVW